MKDGFDVVTDARSLINVQAITSQLTGKIWPFDRPTKRGVKSDIVVNFLGILNTQIQVGTFNVNIYMPNLNETIDGTAWSHADLPNLSRMSKLVLPYVENQYRATFYTDVASPSEPIQDTDGSWFVNIKVKYYSIQTA